jgi:hypothetical protein
MAYTLARYILVIGPYIALACGAAFLWSRGSRLPALLVALGFTAAAVSQIAAAYVSAALSTAVESADGIAAVMSRFRHWEWLTRDLGPAGVWVAAAGFLAHATRTSPPDPH